MYISKRDLKGYEQDLCRGQAFFFFFFLSLHQFFFAPTLFFVYFLEYSLIEEDEMSFFWCWWWGEGGWGFSVHSKLQTKKMYIKQRS